MFIAAVVFGFFSYLFTLVEYAQFSQKGKNNEALRVLGKSKVWQQLRSLVDKIFFSTGRICGYVAQTLFFLMLILIGKGYTVTRSYLRKITVVKIIILFGLYVCAYIITFIYSEAVSITVVHVSDFYAEKK
jgi:hypothetical protein